MTRVFFISTLLSCILCCYTPALACNCPARGTIDQEIDKHDVVFIGQVMEVKPAGILRPGYLRVRLMLMKVYKGMKLLPNPEVVTVFTPDTEKLCRFEFSRRIDYLVFASGNPAFLVTDTCSLTDVQENSKKVLVELEKKIR